MNDHLFLKACRMEPVPRPPVWIMRQAGRIIPDYRELRETISFQDLMKQPEKVAEVTIQPVDYLGVDAAILFTDILIIPEAMGQTVEYVDNHGPVIHEPVRTPSDLSSLDPVQPSTDLDYVMDSIRATVEKLDGRVPLIGFTGGPWTLACYMIEGGSSRRYQHTKGLLYRDPETMEDLLSRITDAVTDVLLAQINAGAQAVQIFDTSAGTLPPGPFRDTVLPFVQRVIERIHDRADVPVIYYGKGTGHALNRILDTNPDVVGVDWTVEINRARELAGPDTAVQGNLDPTVLFADQSRIRDEVRRVIDEYGSGPGHIFNLGHGVYPETDVEHVKTMVRAVSDGNP